MDEVTGGGGRSAGTAVREIGPRLLGGAEGSSVVAYPGIFPTLTTLR
jgi:hypothetical protein